MTEKRLSILQRMARMLRRLRELLDTPTSLSELDKKFDVVAADIRSIRGEISAELSFSIHDFGESLTHVHKLFDDLSERLNSPINSAETLQSEARSLVAELTTSLNSDMNSLRTLQSETKDLVDHVRSASEVRFNAIHNCQFETRNLVDHLNTSINSRLNSFEKSKTGRNVWSDPPSNCHSNGAHKPSSRSQTACQTLPNGICRQKMTDGRRVSNGQD